MNSNRVIGKKGRIHHMWIAPNHKLLEISPEFGCKMRLHDRPAFAVGESQLAIFCSNLNDLFHIDAMESHVYHFYRTNQEVFAKRRISSI